MFQTTNQQWWENDDLPSSVVKGDGRKIPAASQMFLDGKKLRTK